MYSFYILVNNLLKKNNSKSCRVACDICNKSDTELTLYNVEHMTNTSNSCVVD